ncbi:probable tocopherol cyclase, chloroplastic [Phragmites australis]|uniref:probable tocopherol cyclase, chloroplastic n=1 Tax=Phragmites australis TaxID=29695 RepID=UPI002D77EA0F|nr:probable tocopherol cyclase, chloroplastic [Phragmites australis]
MDLIATAAAVRGPTAAPRAPRAARPSRRGRSLLRRAAASSTSSSAVVAAAAAPVYAPTPRDRPLRTPHSGYHFDGTPRPFFEGWYFKVAIPECRQSFCFMYSVENPLFRHGMSDLDQLVHGQRFTGVGAQILGADDKYICQFTEKSNNFWGSRHELMLGNTFIPNEGSTPPDREVPPQEFSNRVLEGFQVTPIWHQGFIRDDGRSKYVPNVQTARWEYSTRPVYGWGDVKSKQLSTAGWLAAFPLFEPHWQICMADGLSTGWIEWDGERFEFENAPSYSEKNWGGAFPRKWYWIQCNVFSGTSGEVALTAAGGLRKIGLGDTYESPSLIGIHYEGKFYEFVPWTGTVSWDIAPWGHWKMSGENKNHLVEIEATTKEPGTTLRAPTSEAGLVPTCKDTVYGDLRLQLWEKKHDGGKGEMILDATSNMAALEVGGGPWFTGWKGTTVTNEVVNSIVGTPVDVESLIPIPFLKPPGL